MENRPNREPVRKLLHFVRSILLCCYSPVPPTVISPKLWGTERRSLCRAQWLLSFMSGSRGHHLNLSPSLTNVIPLRKLLFVGKVHDCGGPAWRGCDASPGAVLQNIASPSDDKVSPKLQRYIGISDAFPCNGKSQCQDVVFKQQMNKNAD